MALASGPRYIRHFGFRMPEVCLMWQHYLRPLDGSSALHHDFCSTGGSECRPFARVEDGVWIGSDGLSKAGSRDADCGADREIERGAAESSSARSSSNFSRAIASIGTPSSSTLRSVALRIPLSANIRTKSSLVDGLSPIASRISLAERVNGRMWTEATGFVCSCESR